MRKQIEQIERLLERQTDQKERDLAKRYASLLLAIQSVLGEFYRRYETDGKLTYVEVIKYDRLQRLNKEIVELINDEDKALHREIVSHLEDQYQESFYRVAHAIETIAQAKLNYSAVRREVLDEAVNIDFTGLTLNERLEKRRQELIYNMREAIVRGLHQGKTYRQMANDIKNELEGDLSKAQRIVRTEAHRVRELAGLKSVQHAAEQGIIMTKTWNTVEDERVRVRHSKLNGVTLPHDGMFKIDGYEAPAPGQFGAPEMDINCRCFLTYEIQEIRKPQHDDLAEMGYEEWKKERLG